MCGLAGVYFPAAGAVAEADLDAMLAVMRHRGPDGSGRFVSQDRRFQIVFARLAIIDRETGGQPIVEDGGRRVLCGNGEIYNYQEIRGDPRIENYRFRSRGDMEVILPLVAALGEDFVHELMGMFALALWEAEGDRLYLIRDRLGIKPLYWAPVRGGGIAFASEIKALFASGLVRPAVDHRAVSAYLSHGYVPAPNTLYAGVFKLPPACILTVPHDGSLVVKRYWRPHCAEGVPRNPDAASEFLTELLRESVRLHLRADVPAGALLSGGIDSGLIVALAAELMPQPLETFTVRFEGAAVDETPLARLVAERYGTRHHEFPLSAGSIIDHLPRLVWHAEEPVADAALLPNDLIEQALSRHVKVALNGTGGDELFAGYRRYFQLPGEAAYLRIPHGVRKQIIEPLIGRVSPMTAFKLRRADKFHRSRGEYLHEHCGPFPGPMRRMIGNRQAAVPPIQPRFFAEFSGPPETAVLACELCSYLPEDLLHLLDRTSMAWSVEGRVPFLDHRLVEAALAIPPEIRAPNGRQKGLERKMAEPFLPVQVLNAPKQGFASPAPVWFRGPLRGLARRILKNPRALEREWWTARGIDKLFADTDRHSFRLYALLKLEMCVRIHVEGMPPADLEAFADSS